MIDRSCKCRVNVGRRFTVIEPVPADSLRKNGNIRGLFAISSLRSANRSSGDKFKCAKSREFRPLLPSLGKSLRRHECVAEAGGFDLDMANSKSDSLARSRRIAEPHPARIHKPLETFEFREPYQICRVRSFGEKRAFWRRMSQFCRIEVRGPNWKSLLLLA